MSGSWREDPSRRYLLRYRDADGWWTDQVKSADGTVTRDPKGIRGTDRLIKRSGTEGRTAFRVAVATVAAAPLVAIAFTFSALGAGFCQDAKPADECPSVDTISAGLAVFMVVAAVLLLVCLAVLVDTVRRPHDPLVPSKSPASEGNRRRNLKASVSTGFAAVATLASSVTMRFGSNDRVVVGVFFAVPPALFGVIFGLRSLAELRVAAGRESGARAAKVGLAIGAAVTVGWALAAVVGV